MNFIVDAHQDLAYNAANFGRDYFKSVRETRQAELVQDFSSEAGETVLGWPEFQKGRVAVIFATLFTAPHQYTWSEIEKVLYKTPEEARVQLQQQVDLYHAWEQGSPDKFHIIRSEPDVDRIMKPWLAQDAEEQKKTNPVGLVILLEGAEAIGPISDMEHWWNQGVRVAGPVWAGTRFCGGTHTPHGFSEEGYRLLDTMYELGYILDLSHMNTRSSLQALDHYQGPVIATHVNARAITGKDDRERQFSDETIRGLISRDGVMGMVMYNHFIKGEWRSSDGKHAVTLGHVADHIDHICQIAGDTRHVAIGSDFDGGFGLSDIPSELDTIADLHALAPVLSQRGYNESDIQNILGGNWVNVLRKGLPA